MCNCVAGRPQFRRRVELLPFLQLRDARTDFPHIAGAIFCRFAAQQSRSNIPVKERQDFLSTTPIDNIVICVTTQRDPCWTGLVAVLTLPAELTCRLDESGEPADESTESTDLDLKRGLSLICWLRQARKSPRKRLLNPAELQFIPDCVQN